MGSPKLSSPTSQSNRIKMKTAAILLATTVGLSLAAPQNAPVWTEITGAYKSEPLKVVRPTTEAALVYMKEFFGEDLCAAAAQAYMESLLSGESGAKASEAAEIAYKAAWRAGARVEPGSPCASAEASFRSSYDSGKDTVTNAALAWAKSWPGLEEGNPCSASTSTYMNAYADGKDQLTSTLIAAKTFYKSYTSGNPPSPSSPCVKANLAFAAKSPLSDSQNNAAMTAFIDKAVEDGNAVADPVCAAATLAFLDAKIAKRSDKEASSAAADAYIEAHAATMGRGRRRA